MSAESSHQLLLDALTDEHPEAFVALKQLLRGSPSSKQWRRLCEALKRWEGCDLSSFEALLAYINEALIPWRRSLDLPIPAQWLERLKQNEPCPQLRLLASLDLTEGWDVVSYAQNVEHLLGLRSITFAKLTSLHESILSTLLHQLELPQLDTIKLLGLSWNQSTEELEVLRELGRHQLPALRHLSLRDLNLSAPTLATWLDASWAPSLTHLTLASTQVETPHLELLFDAAQRGRLDPALRLILPLRLREENRRLHQEPTCVMLHADYIWGYDLYDEPSDADDRPYEDPYMDEGWE